MNHSFLPVDPSSEPISSVFDRFIAAGEGASDHIAAYVDGFAIWKRLHDEGIGGVIRGDTTMALHPIHEASDVWRTQDVVTWDDYENLPTSESVGLGSQRIPDDLKQRQGESLLTWRDRVHRTFRIPTRLAALNDLKTSYVEIANPLLMRSIVRHYIAIPDRFRDRKQIFKDVVDEHPLNHTSGRPVPMASRTSIMSVIDVLGSPDAVALLKESLASAIARKLFPGELLKLVSENTTVVAESRRSMRQRLVDALNPRLKEALKSLMPKRKPRQVLDFRVLAFRIHIVCKMYEILTEDAQQSQSNTES